MSQGVQLLWLSKPNIRHVTPSQPQALLDTLLVSRPPSQPLNICAIRVVDRYVLHLYGTAIGSSSQVLGLIAILRFPHEWEPEAIRLVGKATGNSGKCVSLRLLVVTRAGELLSIELFLRVIRKKNGESTGDYKCTEVVVVESPSTGVQKSGKGNMTNHDPIDPFSNDLASELQSPAASSLLPKIISVASLGSPHLRILAQGFIGVQCLESSPLGITMVPEIGTLSFVPFSTNESQTKFPGGWDEDIVCSCTFQAHSPIEAANVTFSANGVKKISSSFLKSLELQNSKSPILLLGTSTGKVVLPKPIATGSEDSELKEHSHKPKLGTLKGLWDLHQNPVVAISKIFVCKLETGQVAELIVLVGGKGLVKFVIHVIEDDIAKVGSDSSSSIFVSEENLNCPVESNTKIIVSCSNGKSLNMIYRSQGIINVTSFTRHGTSFRLHSTCTLQSSTGDQVDSMAVACDANTGTSLTFLLANSVANGLMICQIKCAVVQVCHDETETLNDAVSATDTTKEEMYKVLRTLEQIEKEELSIKSLQSLWDGQISKHRFALELLGCFKNAREKFCKVSLKQGTGRSERFATASDRLCGKAYLSVLVAREVVARLQPRNPGIVLDISQQFSNKQSVSFTFPASDFVPNADDPKWMSVDVSIPVANHGSINVCIGVMFHFDTLQTEGASLPGLEDEAKRGVVLPLFKGSLQTLHLNQTLSHHIDMEQQKNFGQIDPNEPMLHSVLRMAHFKQQLPELKRHACFLCVPLKLAKSAAMEMDMAFVVDAVSEQVREALESLTPSWSKRQEKESLVAFETTGILSLKACVEVIKVTKMDKSSDILEYVIAMKVGSEKNTFTSVIASHVASALLKTHGAIPTLHQSQSTASYRDSQFRTAEAFALKTQVTEYRQRLSNSTQHKSPEASKIFTQWKTLVAMLRDISSMYSSSNEAISILDKFRLSLVPKQDPT